MPLPERYAEFQGWMREELVERITELECELGQSNGPYRQYDFAAGLEQWMREHGFAATSGASFVDLLDELSAQVSDRPRN